MYLEGYYNIFKHYSNVDYKINGSKLDKMIKVISDKNFNPSINIKSITHLNIFIENSDENKGMIHYGINTSKCIFKVFNRDSKTGKFY